MMVVKTHFLHVSALQAAKYSNLFHDGQAVSYELTEQRGKQAASEIATNIRRTTMAITIDGKTI